MLIAGGVLSVAVLIVVVVVMTKHHDTSTQPPTGTSLVTVSGKSYTVAGVASGMGF